ncbi:MAG: ATP-binding cassette domain-containing protein [Bacteroidota bacterium]
MKIVAENIGKKYGKRWVFRNINCEVQSGTKMSIVGRNGAGKSTLLQMLSGFLTPTEGNIVLKSSTVVSPENIAQHISLIGPYCEIIEEMNLREFLFFHSKYKKPRLSFAEMAEKASLPLEKTIKDFSTGMKQRAALITAFYYYNEAVFFDEPTSNLDEDGFFWWREEVTKMSKVTILIASNKKSEVEICEEAIDLKIK